VRAASASCSSDRDMSHPCLPVARAAGLTLALLLACAGAVLTAQTPPVAPGSLGVPAAPRRRAAAPPPADVPSLPSQADRVVPLTIEAIVIGNGQNGRGSELRQVVSRTRDRVHVVAGAGEWLFERNPVDRRRVSGQYVDHREKAVVAFSDTDLLNLQHIPGWGHVLALGCDAPPSALASSGAPRMVDTLRFDRYVVSGREIWWNHEALLPAECVIAGGTARLRVTRIRGDVAPELLRQPAERFPGYREVDVAEWLEHR